MKQGTIKTLGAVALGAAFAATAAGTAAAAPALDGADATGVVNSLPGQATKALSGATNKAKPATGPVKVTPKTKGNQLLGGLPPVTTLPVGGIG
ncbi:hypothetical protein AB0I10_33545 [Streptomyces sp. NPDC050636]|uniref:hypothetical protein n=1 Tax=Streptomyces sp. NPDC050636 TaxID=3154510 RepID=UPI003442A2FB